MTGVIWKKSSKIWYPSCSIGKIDVLDRHTEQVTPVRKQSLLQVDKIRVMMGRVVIMIIA